MFFLKKKLMLFFISFFFFYIESDIITWNKKISLFLSRKIKKNWIYDTRHNDLDVKYLSLQLVIH